jgi:penicillin-binding protein-related factor A (putative recombinase)
MISDLLVSKRLCDIPYKKIRKKIIEISILRHCSLTFMSTRSPFSLMKIYKDFLKDFELKKNKKMFPSSNIQNDG